MAVPGDFLFLEHLIDHGLLTGRVLELGSYNRQGGDLGNAKTTVVRRGLTWQGTDIESGPGVDFTLDLEDAEAVGRLSERWDAVLAMNLLEHVYDPIRVLEAALRLVGPGGSLVVAGPAVWELHDFPADYWRPLPDFFAEFAARHRCTIVPGGLRWIVFDRLVEVELLTRDGQKLLPSAQTANAMWGTAKTLRSKLLHRLGRTFGRDVFFPYVGLGVCIRPSANGT